MLLYKLPLILVVHLGVKSSQLGFASLKILCRVGQSTFMTILEL